MSLMKRNPTKEVEIWNRNIPIPFALDRLQREMNRAFDGLFRGDILDRGSFFSGTWSPAVDISESGDSYIISAELPGMKKEDVKITMNDNFITLRGEKKNESEKTGGTFTRIERSYGAFERTFTLPAFVKSDAIEARYNDGILTITLPKREEVKEKVIDVKVK